jgi:hypothetical protein
VRAALLMMLAALPARAFDPFEIQVYDGTADAPGEPGIEIHLNRHHDATHLTFEPSIGITRFWELGAYLQFQQGTYQGVKLRSKFVTPEGALGPFRLGINFEIALQPGDRWGGEIRPILAFENRRFLIAINPNIGFPFSSEPAAMAKVKLGAIALGVEYYGSLPDEHYLLAAIDLLSVKHLELNLGVGGGSAPVGKLIVGYAF